MKANTTTIRTRITRAVEALRAACAKPEEPHSVPLVPLRGNPMSAPLCVTSTPTGSFTVIDCAFTREHDT